MKTLRPLYRSQENNIRRVPANKRNAEWRLLWTDPSVKETAAKAGVLTRI
jgi:hypothetical protein